MEIVPQLRWKPSGTLQKTTGVQEVPKSTSDDKPLLIAKKIQLKVFLVPKLLFSINLFVKHVLTLSHTSYWTLNIKNDTKSCAKAECKI
ncbi:unnamed protein product [Caenorhabditis brenneri]